MRIVPFFVSTLVTGGLIFALQNKWPKLPRVGAFLSPQQGFWQNAEPSDENFSADLSLPGVKGKTTVYIDERLVPHVFAQHEEDAYYAQGYLHAKFRLWQMEFQTLAAAGRLSEKLWYDPNILRLDREHRRLGMVYGAENAVKEMEKDARSKAYFDAYTAGVNAYIDRISEADLPLEYKLLGYKPEHWSNLKTALFLKMMSKDLAGYERDLEYTNQRKAFSLADMRELYPELSDSSKPIIPAATLFAAAGIVPVKPTSADSLYFRDTTLRSDSELIMPVEQNKPIRANGSNSWAVAGSRTASGAPILCNDPHLTLSLPSIWFEMQLHTPTMNVYGATFPGSPSVIIGFNEHIAFGFTNAMRDVKDYYEIRFRDASKKEYWYNGQWKASDLRIEEIKIGGGETFYDTVAYSVWGPVMYDAGFSNDVTANRAIAVQWLAHQPSNEGAMWFQLDRAKNYDEFYAAIRDYVCPGQNMLFAGRNGEIALWQQGRFPARWDGQGLYVMPGDDSSYRWQGYIPQSENPFVRNPAEGFIQSANQRPVSGSYPYFIPGNYITPRGITIHEQLSRLNRVTPQMMMALQNNTFSSLAQDAVPLMLRYIDTTLLSDRELDCLRLLRRWDYRATAESQATAIYQATMDSLETMILGDEMARVGKPSVYPDEQTLVELLLRDSASRFVDDIRTPETEPLALQMTRAFQRACSVVPADTEWWQFKNTTIYHLLRESMMPLAHKGIKVGGWSNTPNAITHKHGPSWRMIVEMSSPVTAYGIYPGGQSGNPGSRFYDNFTNDWAAGRYYTLWMMQASEARDPRVKWTITINPA